MLRLGDAHGAIDPVYGRQVQPRAVHGLQSEGRLELSTAEAGPIAVRFEPTRGPLARATKESLRQAPALLTARAIAAVDEDAIRALADPDDKDGDGISGRVREADGRVGRFGWKAAFPRLDDQIADAFAFDMGLSTPHTPLPHGDCTSAEPDCLAAPTGRSAAFDGEEISAEMLRLVAAYVGSLVPAPAAEPDGMGDALFAQTGCGACHVPAMPAKDGAVMLYSDLLLHDLGPDLDDGVGEPGAASSEWRTAPLLALSARLAGGGRLLHDGRAATVDAAIRAHGGEAEGARSRYHDLPAADRAALTRFVEGL